MSSEEKRFELQRENGFQIMIGLQLSKLMQKNIKLWQELALKLMNGSKQLEID
jgi:hypothetical protein